MDIHHILFSILIGTAVVILLFEVSYSYTLLVRRWRVFSRWGCLGGVLNKVENSFFLLLTGNWRRWLAGKIIPTGLGVTRWFRIYPSIPPWMTIFHNRAVGSPTSDTRMKPTGGPFITYPDPFSSKIIPAGSGWRTGPVVGKFSYQTWQDCRDSGVHTLRVQARVAWRPWNDNIIDFCRSCFPR